LQRHYIVTGTVRVEGGETNRMKMMPQTDETRVREHVTVVQERDISKDRRRANVISTDYMRKLRAIRFIKTPYGALVAPEKLKDLRELLDEVNHDIAVFNKTSTRCRLTNCVLPERLSGERLSAVEGWLARQVKDDRAHWKPIVEELLAS